MNEENCQHVVRHWINREEQITGFSESEIRRRWPTLIVLPYRVDYWSQAEATKGFRIRNEWCSKNFGKGQYAGWCGLDIVFGFDKPANAAMFKLAWGGETIEVDDY